MATLAELLVTATSAVAALLAEFLVARQRFTEAVLEQRQPFKAHTLPAGLSMA
jgi:hypothetical protein